MAIIYSDTWLNPPGNYPAGRLDVVDTNWSNAGTFGGANFWNVITTSGGALQLNVFAADTLDYWSGAGTWTPLTLGAWSEFTFLNQLLASGGQIGLVCALTSPGAAANFYLCRIRSNSAGAGNQDITFYYYSSGYTSISGPFAITLGPTDVCALQVTYTGTLAFLTFFQNYVANGNSPNDTHIGTGGPSGIWQHNMTAGNGDIGTARGGTGLYPGSGAAPTAPTAATQLIVFP